MALRDDDIIELAKKYELPPEIALAIYSQESKSGADTRDSPKGAKGGFQVMPATFKAMGGSDINDEKQNAEAGIKYLAEGYKKHGSVEGTAAFYHAGPQWQRKLQANPDLGDGNIRTVDYVKSVRTKANEIKGRFKNMDEESLDVSGITDVPSSSSTDPGLGAGPTVVTGTKRPDVVESIATLLKEAEAVSKNIIDSSAAMSAQIKENLKQQVKSVGKQGELQATVQLEAFRLQQTKATDNARTLSRLGVNTDDMDSIVAQLSTQMAAEAQEAFELREQINANRQQGGFNILDPVGSYVRATQTNADIRAHNQLVDSVAAKKRYLDQAASVAQNISAVNSLKHTSVTAEGAKAAADLQIEIANSKAIEVEDKLTKVDFDAQVRTLNALTMRMNSLQALDTAEQNGQIKRATAEKKAADEELKKIEDDRIKVAGRVLGLEVTGRKDLDKQAPDVKMAVERVMASTSAEGSGAIAKNPLEAQEILARGNLNRMPPSTSYMARTLKAFRTQVEAEIDANPVTKAMPKEQRIAAINDGMYKKFKEYSANPAKPMVYGANGKDEWSNPFEMPTVQVLEKDLNAKDLKITKILKQHATAFPQATISDNLVVELAFQNANISGIYNNVMEAAKDVADYYRAGVNRNNLTYKFEDFGLAPQQNYIVRGYDMANYADVTKMMLRKFGAYSSDPIPFGLDTLANNMPGA